MVRTLKHFGAVAALLFSLTAAYADDSDTDSNADLKGSFEQLQSTLKSSVKGVIVRVPVDKDGKEMGDKAEVRTYNGGEKIGDSSTSKLVEVFDNAKEQPKGDSDQDSNTSHWGWRHHHHYHYSPYYCASSWGCYYPTWNYYYSYSYYPTYYYYPSYNYYYYCW